MGLTVLQVPVKHEIADLIQLARKDSVLRDVDPTISFECGCAIPVQSRARLEPYCHVLPGRCGSVVAMIIHASTSNFIHLPRAHPSFYATATGMKQERSIEQSSEPGLSIRLVQHIVETKSKLLSEFFRRVNEDRPYSHKLASPPPGTPSRRQLDRLDHKYLFPR
jgi:hypothetical protein